MSAPLSIVVYVTIWWIVLFAILPIGVRSATEAGVVDAPQGSDPGAPAAPNLGRKALWTTLVAAVVFVALDFYVYVQG
jgi:predicted secreted protein